MLVTSMHTVTGEQSLSTQYEQIATADAEIMIHSNATTYKVWGGGGDSGLESGFVDTVKVITCFSVDIQTQDFMLIK